MIPVFEPTIGDEEIASVEAALRCGEISGSFGETIPSFESEFAKYCGVRHAIAVNSGTSALHLAVDAAGIGPGDEVLVSASTNVATALAVHHNGATPVAVDSESETWNLDLDLLESQITPHTKAILPVHLYGCPVDMDRVMEIAQRHDLIVIEDAAEAHGAECRGSRTGSFGHMGCFSFYANKVITTGEGGMIVTDDDDFAERLRLLRNMAFTKPRFRHELAGYNFRMTGMQAAIGRVQLSKIESIIQEKRRIAATYNHYLANVPGVRLPLEPEWARHVYWMYAIELTSEFGVSRDELAVRLRANDIDTRTFFCPMNQQPCLEIDAKPCPVADRLWKSGLYLPSSLHLTEQQISWISQQVQAAAIQLRRRAA